VEGEQVTLDIRDLRVPGGDPVSASVGRTGWERVAHPDPAALLAALAGLDPVAGQVTVDGVELEGLTPAARARAGLATAPGRLPPLPGLRVLDVLLLGRCLEPTTAWRAAVGSRRARAQLADAEAWARAVAGRLGIARWADRAATGLPADVVALTDLGRAVGSRPRAIAWQVPIWLEDRQVIDVERALGEEQAIGGWAVLEVRGSAAPARHRPLILEITD
jgi:hypothetical protein